MGASLEVVVICPCGYAQNTDEMLHCKQCGGDLEPIRRKQAEGTRDWDRYQEMAKRRQGQHGETKVRAESSTRRHMLVALGLDPLVLDVDNAFSIGRATDSALPIDSKRVSRKHAEIIWKSGLPVLRNVSTSNSTLVNGKAIKEHELRDGDEIKIGPYTCEYRRSGGPPTEGDEMPEMGLTIADPLDSAMSGNLEQMNLFALLRTFEVRKKTGCLTVQSGSEEGEIGLAKGRIKSVELGTRTGKSALFEMLGWAKGSYNFDLEKKKTARKLIRKFDYSMGSDVGKKDELQRQRISDLLDEAEEEGILEPLPPKPGPKPKPAPQPQRRRPPPPGARRRPPPRPGGRPPAETRPAGRPPQPGARRPSAGSGRRPPPGRQPGPPGKRPPGGPRRPPPPRPPR